MSLPEHVREKIQAQPNVREWAVGTAYLHSTEAYASEAEVHQDMRDYTRLFRERFGMCVNMEFHKEEQTVRILVIGKQQPLFYPGMSLSEYWRQAGWLHLEGEYPPTMSSEEGEGARVSFIDSASQYVVTEVPENV